ncbi:alpha/beta hydrolase [Belnapia rosea]|nr:alpha/beta hydrolase [Belnapia rosea]
MAGLKAAAAPGLPAMKEPAMQTASHLTPDGRLGDILRHPAFAGFARLLLPWDGRAYDDAMPLRQIATLLPYHSRVDPVIVTSALNRMIDDVRDGQPVFHAIYSEAQQQAQPAKANTGLFFFRGRPGASFALIAPGGGFAYVGSVHEGFPYAQAISEAGYNAFVLRYRTGQGGIVATEDLAAAISYVFRHAEALGLCTLDYSLWGSSAGARMAAFIGSHGVAHFGGDALPKPSTVVMAYTAHQDLGTDDPATFAIVGAQDGIAPPSSMEHRLALLRRSGTPVAYRRHDGLGHGFGTGAGTAAEGWIADAMEFWQAHRAGSATGRPDNN